MTVNEQVRGLREAQGKTQQDVAVLAGLSITAVQKVEQGRHQPRLDTAIKLARAVGRRVAIVEERLELVAQDDADAARLRPAA